MHGFDRAVQDQGSGGREVNVDTWIVEFRDLDDIVQGTWSRNGVYVGDEAGARDDYRILKEVYVSVRIGKTVTKIEWESHE